MIRIRRATYPDLDRLMQIFDEARYTISLLGIDQWQDGYPSRSVISEDIAAGTSYCVENEGNICGTFMLLSAKEPTYDFIEGGSWLTDDRERGYLAIHRVAIAVDQRGQGISTRIIEFASEYAKKLNRASLRIDTHQGNLVMRRMLEKHGFRECGIIYLESGAKRVAYERMI